MCLSPQLEKKRLNEDPIFSHQFRLWRDMLEIKGEKEKRKTAKEMDLDFICN